MPLPALFLDRFSYPFTSGLIETESIFEPCSSATSDGCLLLNEVLETLVESQTIQHLAH
jgi:hypothetical protein